MEPARAGFPSLTNATTIGCEWVIDAFDCIPERLRELETLRALCDTIIRELQLHVVGEPTWHQFPGEAGVTGLYLLSESHLACHTYPEVSMATFNLYCCRTIPQWPWAETLQRQLGAAHCDILHFERGARRDPMQRGYPRSRGTAPLRESVQWESVP